MSSVSNWFKRFLHNHSKSVDFVSASLIICLCLIILLPKVHDSFQTTPDDDDQQQPEHNHNNALGDEQENTVGQLAANLVNLVDTLPSTANLADNPNNHNHHHHHDHKLPVGEVIICLGFFVFYCIGLGMGKTGSFQENEPLLMAERKISAVCCSSTRCPSGQREVLETSAGDNDSARYKSLTEEGFLDGASEEDCVFALNRHHNHHTHVRHHEHQPQVINQTVITSRTGNDYGSTSRNTNAMNVTPDLVKSNDDTVYVEEIKITRRSVDYDKTVCLQWPPSVRYTLFGLLLSIILIVFDMNIQGLFEAIKVFRAAATGALLYMAFFIVLPKDPAGCNSCTEEEVVA